MKKAIYGTDTNRSKDKDYGIITRLKDEIKRKGDFPAISQTTISILKSQTSSGGSPAFNELAETIMGDFGLTSKILTLVNSVFYAGSTNGGKVDSISRAMFILGFEKIKSIVISFSMMDTLSNMNLPIETKDVILSSFLSGFITRGAAEKIKHENVETSYISSIFHNLGKLLISYYMPEIHKSVVDARLRVIQDEDNVSASIIGMSYRELGIAIAREWNIADEIIGCMYKLSDTDLASPLAEERKMQAIVNFSNELCFIVKDLEKKPQLLNRLSEKYSEIFVIPENVVIEIVERSLSEIESYAGILQIKLDEIPFMSQIKGVVILSQSGVFFESDVVKPVINEAARQQEEDDSTKLEIAVSQSSMQSSESKTPSDVSFSEKVRFVEPPVVPESDVLILQPYEDIPVQKQKIRILPDKDKIKTLLKELHTQYKFTRVLMFTRNAFGTFMEARFGIGKDADKALQYLQFKLAADGGVFTDGSVFNLSLSKNSAIAIKDTTLPKSRKYLPEWLAKYINARQIIVIPVIFNGETPRAVIYADSEETASVDFNDEMAACSNACHDRAMDAFCMPGSYLPSRGNERAASDEAGDNKSNARREQTVFWCRKLRRAIKNNTFMPFFQPIVSNSTGKVEMFECLARIVENELVILPGRFLRHARLFGMIPAVTMEIVKQSYNAVRSHPYGLNINVTDADIENDVLRIFFEFFAGQINFQSKQVIIEVQPSCRQLDMGRMESALRFLKKTGFKTAIDNVCVSQSDLKKLIEGFAEFIDYVKIDGALIKHIPHDEKYRNAVKHIAMIAKRNKIKCIATFVDDEVRHDLVRKMGIEYSQGYHFGKPRRYFSEIRSPLL